MKDLCRKYKRNLGGRCVAAILAVTVFAHSVPVYALAAPGIETETEESEQKTEEVPQTEEVLQTEEAPEIEEPGGNDTGSEGSGTPESKPEVSGTEESGGNGAGTEVLGMPESKPEVPGTEEAGGTEPRPTETETSETEETKETETEETETKETETKETETEETETEETGTVETEETEETETETIETETETETEILETETETETETESETAVCAHEGLYEDGRIRIYTLEQLQAIGTDQILTDTDCEPEGWGAGEPVLAEEETITYGLDAAYELMNEIVLDEDLWLLPEGFTGSFSGAQSEENEGLYEEETDTIRIFHNYQLMILASEDREEAPVMTGDRIPEKTGMGQCIYPENAEDDAAYLTYSKSHQYVIAASFTAAMPELLGEELADEVVWLEGEAANGRTVPGQLYVDINGEKYILIGNEMQLRAIGSDAYVTPRLYLYNDGGLGGTPKYIPYYPGDADLGLMAVPKEGGTTHKDGIFGGQVPDKVEQLDYKYSFYGKDLSKQYELAKVELKKDDILGGILEGLFGVGGILGGILGGITGTKTVFCGVDENGRPNHEKASLQTLREEYGDLKYSANANYIIFRDIDLSENGDNSDKKGDDWQPIPFSGKMEGWREMDTKEPVTIQNINIQQTGKVDLSKMSGIGFFGTIENEINSTDFSSAGTAVVKNLHLDQITVNNISTEIDSTPDSLVEGVLGALGGLLGGLVGGITENLEIINGLKLGEVIRGLLTLKQEQPDLFATGSFAGRIVGDVRIENCWVTGASVHNVKDMTGGFAGYTDGEARYDLLSTELGKVVKTLAGLLNVLPGVGLGDLITLLLDKNISLGNLIPIGYDRPQLVNCRVELANGAIGSSETQYNGGFIGMQAATVTEGCSVEGLRTVMAKNGAGGFAGVERDGVLKGALQDLGVDVNAGVKIRSEQKNCRITGTEIEISAAENYAGGWNGLMANSSSENGSIEFLRKVSAGHYAGGIAGRATIGYGLTAGNGLGEKSNLLSSVSGLLDKLVSSGNTDTVNKLLSLSGASASQILGSQVTGTALEIAATEQYAGGVTGKGDGTKIAAGENGIPVRVAGLHTVEAGSYAGGIAGSLVTADAIGVLNSTVGVGQYLPFQIENVTVEGNGMSIRAKDAYAAGGAGLLLGGTVRQVAIQGLQEIQTGNYAGGFVGRAGTASLADTGGLDILGLVKVSNLLSLADGTGVKVGETRVTGVAEGCIVKASGANLSSEVKSVLAGGFAAEAVAMEATDCAVSNLKQVTAEKAAGRESYAGGFLGRSHTGGLAGLAQEDDDHKLQLPGIVNVTSLLDLVPYLQPNYERVTVHFSSNGGSPQVEAGIAGGFAGALQSGVVDNQGLQEAYAVYELESVRGQSYAGGFAGKADAGATASSDGLKLLNGKLKLNVTDLLKVLDVYVPRIKYAGVQSAAGGFVVEATAPESSAGGYIGYGSGVQIDNSHVTSLKHTKVTPPADSLESADGNNYFTEASSYAVKGGNYAGGYIGCADLDSAAAVGGGLQLLDGSISLDHVASALQTVASSITNSSVNGQIGGFSVLANHAEEGKGKAGGFAGAIEGAKLKNAHARNFAYIIGRERAGGYAGEMEPGNAASVLEEGTILNGLAGVSNLADLVSGFVPELKDCQASSVPCGGVVRAEGLTDQKTVRGIAGGYVGYQHGGSILGETMPCAVERIRSVYGGEFAGGFAGLMETAELASGGNLELLFGLVQAGNVLNLLGAVYPTEMNTSVYGPLRNLDVDTWNAWVEAVGSGGVYGSQLPSEKAASQEELDGLIRKYAYGYQVKTGRTETGKLEKQAGSAGGYVGRMKGGIVTEAHGWDAQAVTAYQSAGGFAGEMLTGGAAEVGGIKLAGLQLTSAVSALQTFVPVIRNADLTGYQSGLQVKVTGRRQQENSQKLEPVGYAGGYVGHMVGGQIWGNWTAQGRGAVDAKPDPDEDRCLIANLRKVEGTNAIGGFAGQIDPGSAAALDTGSNGLLDGLLAGVIGDPAKLLSVLNSTLSTVRGAGVQAWDDWGIVVNGAYTSENANSGYAFAAGGFAGAINGAVIGEKGTPESGVSVEKIRSVTGGAYAGGFFGLADVSAVAEVGVGGETSILAGLLKAGSIDALDAFRTYIYESDVSGTADAGLEVRAREGKQKNDEDPVFTGSAGGFGGALLNGSVKNSTVTQLRSVEAQNYAGGFIGHMGKSGVVDADSIKLLENVLGAGVGVMDIFGSHVDDSRVEGMEDGFTVAAENTGNQEKKAEIAGGFAGYADLARMTQNTVSRLKQVTSPEIAGGFAGKTSFAYLVNVEADSPLVNQLFRLLDQVLQQLWMAELQEGEVIRISLGVLTVDALYQNGLVHLNLLGLDIRIRLVKDRNLAEVMIGDSVVRLSCDEKGGIQNAKDAKKDLQLSLIKANRTKIDGCRVDGIAAGYDVYGGGAGNGSNGSGEKGYAGGFVGLNNEGLLKNNLMTLADVVRGAPGLTGPFTGATELQSSWDFNTKAGIEGEENYYRIYREPDPSYKWLWGQGKQELQHTFETNTEWNIYTIKHRDTGKVEEFSDLKDASMSNGTLVKALDAYLEEGAMAVLMNDTPTEPTEPGDGGSGPDIQDPCKETVQLRIKKVWKTDKEEERPNKIVLHITRWYEGENGIRVDDTDFNKEIILTAEDQITENVWEKVLAGQDYKAYHVGDGGVRYYYTYQISEDALDGYDTKITYQGEYQYDMTITNQKRWLDSLLPETGGMGTALFYAIGILLLTILGVTKWVKPQSGKQNHYKKNPKRKKRKGKQRRRKK